MTNSDDVFPLLYSLSVSLKLFSSTDNAMLSLSTYIQFFGILAKLWHYYHSQAIQLEGDEACITTS